MNLKHDLKKQFPWLLTVFFLVNCTNADFKKKQTFIKQTTENTIEENEVETIILTKQPFIKEIISNGKLSAIQKSNLKFEISERLEKVLVKNGDFVKRNQILATLNSFRYRQKVEEAKLQLERAKLEFEDMLIGRGIFTTNKDSIPEDIYAMVSSRTGYDIALLQLKTALFELNSTKLIAPFNGKVANIEKKQYENVNAGKDFMTIINDKLFEVEFRLIESEITNVKIGDLIKIVPFAMEELIFNGKISSINPIIDQNGTILIKAIVKNKNTLLKEGMNVDVRIQKEIKNQYVIPKSAIVLRQNKEVLFKVKNGKSFWTYVKTTMENSSSYSVIADPSKNSSVLKSNDTIITTGNLNLAHESKISIINN